jgi:hypothetical protein
MTISCRIKSSQKIIIAFHAFQRKEIPNVIHNPDRFVGAVFNWLPSVNQKYELKDGCRKFHAKCSDGMTKTYLLLTE